MSGFADDMLLRFLAAPFVEDFLTNRVGLAPLFAAAYVPSDVDVRELALGSVRRTEFGAPTIETTRIVGSQERLTPTQERVQMERSMKRFGRLVWVDVLLDLLLAVKVQDLRMPLDSIEARDLLIELGGAATIDELRTKLEARYPASVVTSMFGALRITTIEEFKERLNLFMKFLFKAPPPFNPADPASGRTFTLGVCVKFQADLNVSDALQNAKLTRSVMQRELDYLPQIQGTDVRNPYAFVTVFPDAVAVDGAIPGLTAAQIRTGVQNLFTAEGMVAHFFAP